MDEDIAKFRKLLGNPAEVYKTLRARVPEEMVTDIDVLYVINLCRISKDINEVIAKLPDLDEDVLDNLIESHAILSKYTPEALDKMYDKFVCPTPIGE